MTKDDQEPPAGPHGGGRLRHLRRPMEGLYSAAAGMAAQQRRLEAVANDLANVNTSGYKRTRVSFRDLVYTPSGRGSAPGVSSGAGAAADITGRSFSQGTLVP